eukprot:m.23791 g.23791  ORF g.23791 m.23791 type:complete len:370 (-) comp14360_c0_seq1:141-1250(-)
MSTMKLWLREEVKPFEHRTALTPDVCKILLAEGFEITVEKMESRCVPISEYESVGCKVAEAGSWVNAPKDNVIVGLKELPEDGSALVHKHIYFGHAYKTQGGWKELLGRFDKGGGMLLDLEYLTTEKGQRVAAFGFMAGFAGAAVGLLQWCHDNLNPGTPMPKLNPYPNEEVMIKFIQDQIKLVIDTKKTAGPSTLVMGALGRCGNGAVSLLEKVGVPSESIIKWDMEQTKKGGPFPETLQYDIFVNCIYLNRKIPPFLTEEILESDTRQLKVLVDVSCDTTNPNNPIPFANQATTFEVPAFTLTPSKGPAISVIAIDHLPTMLPLESSKLYSADLLPTIQSLKEFDTAPVWTRVSALYAEKLALSKAE